MRALLDGGLGQPDEDLFGQAAGGDVDLDLNGQGLDADEREGFEFGEHNGWQKQGLVQMQEIKLFVLRIRKILDRCVSIVVAIVSGD